MSQPLPFETQNIHDDDAQVIDSFFIETDAPPDLKDALSPILVKELKDPQPFTRTMSSEVNVDPLWLTPHQLLPADAGRKFIFIRVEGAVATDGIRFSDDLGTVKTAGKVLSGKDGRLDFHTGPLYVWTCGASAGLASAVVSVSFWTVTV